MLNQYQHFIEKDQSPIANYFLVSLCAIFLNIAIIWGVINPHQVFNVNADLFIEIFTNYFFQSLGITVLFSALSLFLCRESLMAQLRVILLYFAPICLYPLQSVVFISMYDESRWLISLLFCLSASVSIWGLYQYLKMHSIKLNKFFLIWPILLVFAFLPYILKWCFSDVISDPVYSVFTPRNIVLLLLPFLIFVIAYHVNQRVLMAIIKDARYLRVLHYLLLLMLGVALGFQNNPYEIKQLILINPDIVFNFLMSVISIIFACLYAIVVNNIADKEIDAISNQNRPLVKGVIDIKAYEKLGFFYLFLAMFYSMWIDTRALLLVSFVMASYFLYSSPPFRLKRIPVLSKLVISLNSIAMVVLGYILVNGQVQDFPHAIYYIYLLLFTLAANMIDLKDVAGDAAAGVLTLPVWIGERKAKLLIGIGALATPIAFVALLPNLQLAPALILIGIVQFYLINKRNYNEKPIILINDLSMMGFIGYLLLLKIFF